MVRFLFFLYALMIINNLPLNSEEESIAPVISLTERVSLNLNAENSEWLKKKSDINEHLFDDHQFPWDIAIIVILLISLAVFLWKRPKKKRVYHKSISPKDEALTSLKGLTVEKDPKRSYGQLIDVIRKYIERKYAVKATKQTSQEFIESLKTRSIIKKDVTSSLQNFLKKGDEIKFAKKLPSDKELLDATLTARTLIEQDQ